MGEPTDIGDPKRLHDSDEAIVPQTGIKEQEPLPDAEADAEELPITGTRPRLRGISNYHYNRG